MKKQSSRLRTTVTGARVLGRLGVLAAIALGGLSWGMPAAQAAHVVQKPQTTSSAIFVNEPATITVTAQVGVDPYLIPRSVNLVRLDDHGTQVAVMGRMYDDGTHGDALVGDGKFTTRVTLSSPTVTTIRLAVTAAYRGSLLRTKSPSVVLSVLQHLTDQEIRTLEKVQRLGTSFFSVRRAQVGDDQARADLVHLLLQQPGVDAAGIGSGQQLVWIHYSSGLRGAIFTGPAGTLGGVRASAPTRSVPGLALAMTPSPQPVLTGSTHAIVLDPFNSQFGGLFGLQDATDHVADDLGRFCGGSPVVLKDADVTVDLIRSLHQYGTVYINTHGGEFTDPDGGPPVVIFATREETSEIRDRQHEAELILHQIRPCGAGDQTVYAIAPSFLDANSGGGFPQSLVVMSSCDSFGADGSNTSMDLAFRRNGAATYFGNAGTVSSISAAYLDRSLFDTLTDSSLSANDRTTGKAYQGILFTGGFEMDGSSDLALQDDLIVNGSFETGDLTGWAADTDLGYHAAVSEDQSEGSYSARIGRWDQPYTAGGGFLGPGVPGAEPQGIDFISQEVLLPTDATSLALSFDYNLVTFDGASYDWLDMKVQDADTGSTLATPVSHVGGIIAGSPDNWGLFYTTNWQHVSYDLSRFAGRHIRLFFGVQQDGYGDQCAAYIDKVSIKCLH